MLTAWNTLFFSIFHLACCCCSYLAPLTQVENVTTLETARSATTLVPLADVMRMKFVSPAQELLYPSASTAYSLNIALTSLLALARVLLSVRLTTPAPTPSPTLKQPVLVAFVVT